MRAQTLTEFAEDMRRKGDIRQSDLADEILALIDVEEEVAEPYSTLCGDIEDYAKDYSDPTDARRALEWLGDRSNLLEEIEKLLDEDGRTGDTDDQVKALLELLDTMKAAEAILEEHGWPGTDFLDALENLAENVPTPKEYDL